jgi:hypothetical protein
MKGLLSGIFKCCGYSSETATTSSVTGSAEKLTTLPLKNFYLFRVFKLRYLNLDNLRDKNIKTVKGTLSELSRCLICGAFHRV